MDAIALLKADHRKVEELFAKIDELGPNAHVSRARIFAEIDRELGTHLEVEETIFYTAVKTAAAKESELKEEVLEAYEEHAGAKELLAKIASLAPEDESYNAKLQVLMEQVKHHVKEEETTFFPNVRKLFDKAELEELGDKLAQAKERRLQSV
ncbi:MAG TPA: hemerythrin domain-containing protein [Candidatus Acidoferrales bacterium]|nr:hemerythrin domain-containing protein [Candidatus Acidoferrales bacterium]